MAAQVPVIIGRRRSLVESLSGYHSSPDRELHFNASPDPLQRFLLAEVEGVLGEPVA